MSDPDVERAEQHARDYLTRTLTPYITAGTEPYDLARHYVAWLRREGWWPALRPPADRPPPDPEQAAAVAHRGAALARAALTREDHPHA